MTDYTQLDAMIESLGLKYSAVFVPQSRSRNAKEDDKTLNWKISISKERKILEVEYSQGIANLPDYNKLRGPKNTIYNDDYLRECVESGKYAVDPFPRTIPNKAIPAPLLRDVLYSTVSDSDVLQHSDFESWAGEYGYSPDSRSAEKIYRLCLAHALALSNMIGNEALDALREAFQDY